MANINWNFSDKVALITGGAQGIGFEICKSFLNSGAKVAIWDYSQESLKTAETELAKWPEHVHLQQVNVTDRSSCKQASEALPWDIDVLVNNAGITRDKCFSKMTDEDFDAVIATNLTGLYNVTKSVHGRFNAEGSARRIINMSSVVAHFGNFGQTNYVAAKAGVIGLTKTWAKEFGRKGFTVNAIAPGFTMTSMTKAMPQEILDQMAQKVAVQRLGSTADIANACLFLASEEASYVNGCTLNVDGGLVI